MLAIPRGHLHQWKKLLACHLFLNGMTFLRDRMVLRRANEGLLVGPVAVFRDAESDGQILKGVIPRCSE